MLEAKDVDAFLKEAEAKVPQLREGCEKRVVWAGETGQKTACVLLYIHGFSATGEELRPLPDLVAAPLGANIYFTRLTGHGQDGAAMGSARIADWRADLAEAFEVANALGDHVIVMGCSTGCTLATLALAEGAEAAAVIHISPNFGLANRAVQLLLDMPGVRHWGNYVAGRERAFEPINPEHAKYWTIKYPTEAVYTMADAVRAVRKADLSKVMTPSYFALNEADEVVAAADTRKVARRWGGPTEMLLLTPGEGDDESGHVMAGRIFSPNQTEPLARQISAWLEGVLPEGATCAAVPAQAD